MADPYAYYIEADLSAYTGEWVAIVNDKVVSHSRDIKEAYREAKEKYPDKRPVLAKVPEKEALIFLGAGYGDYKMVGWTRDEFVEIMARNMIRVFIEGKRVPPDEKSLKLEQEIKEFRESEKRYDGRWDNLEPPYDVDFSIFKKEPGWITKFYPQKVPGKRLWYTWGFDVDRNIATIFKKDIPSFAEARRWVRENEHRYPEYDIIAPGEHGHMPLCAGLPPEMIRAMSKKKR